MSREIVLIAYKFPPYPGVGGFRWAKLCKELAEKGIKIHVLTIDWKVTRPDSLTDDIKNPNIIIHRQPISGLIKLFNWTPQNRYLSFLKRMFNRFVLTPVFFPLEEIQGWDKILIPYCERLIQERDIKVLIATGAPFLCNYWAAKIKKANPQIKLIQDLRDWWTDDPFIKRSISIDRKLHEMEIFSLENADAIVCISSTLLGIFCAKLSTKSTQRQEVISNGYDETKLPSNIKKLSLGDAPEAVIITYAGSLFNGRDLAFAEFASELERKNFYGQDVKIFIFGAGLPHRTRKNFERLYEKGIISELGFVPQNKVFEYISNSTYALHINSKETEYALSTKLFEYGMLKIPTLSVNYGGEVDSLIKSTDLGVSLNLNEGNWKSDLERVFMSRDMRFGFNVHEFSLKAIGRKYFRLIESLE